MNLKQTVSFTKHATNIFFHILTACNLKCKHCYINPKAHGENILPQETIIKWLEIFKPKALQARLIFLGGEPTLHPDLASIIRQTRLLGFKSITIDTNGYLFHNIIKKLTPEEVEYFSFSLDGATRDINDALRGSGSYDTCINGIKQAVQRGFGVSLIYTANSLNINELKSMPPLLLELGIERFFIQVIGLRGRSGLDVPNLQISLNDHQKIIETAAQAASLGITTTYPEIYLQSDQKFECAGVVADNYFIFPNGRVYCCPLCEDYPLHSLFIRNNQIVSMPGLNEKNFFDLHIPEGCIMNKLIQPGNLVYDHNHKPKFKIACCMLKTEVDKIRK